MRATAFVRNNQEAKRVMLCTAQEGCYIFIYDSLADGPCNYDFLQDDVVSTKSMCLADYGIAESDWNHIPDALPECQQDWISPVRVIGRVEGDPQFGTFECLENGVWKRINITSNTAPN
jgi:hypothetical protein